jgi:hypothetical protein
MHHRTFGKFSSSRTDAADSRQFRGFPRAAVRRGVITDEQAGLFAGITGEVLTAGPDAHLAPTRYQDWIKMAR